VKLRRLTVARAEAPKVEHDPWPLTLELEDHELEVIQLGLNAFLGKRDSMFRERQDVARGVLEKVRQIREQQRDEGQVSA
jgi:hypothetical protein